MKKPMIFEGVVVILLLILLFVMYVIVTSQTYQWDFKDSDTISSIGLGDDGTLYAFAGDSGSAIYAINPNGTAKWNYRVPDGWCASNYFVSLNLGYGSDAHPYEPVFTSEDGVMYVYERHNYSIYKDFEPWEIPWTVFRYYPLQEKLVAISPEGRVLWEAPLGATSYPYSNVRVYAKDGRIYAFNDYNLTVLDGSGRQLFKLADISDPPAVDDDGYIYAIAAMTAPMQYSGDYDMSMSSKQPSSTVEAFYPNGSLYWHRDVVVPVWRPYLSTEDARHRYGTIPIYQNDTLYVPTQNGVWALDMDGRYRWAQSFGEGTSELFDAMPLDLQGRVYFQNENGEDPGPGQRNSFRIVTDSGKNVTAIKRPDSVGFGNMYGDPYTGAVYYGGNASRKDGGTISDLYGVELTAFDVATGREAWNYTLRPTLANRLSFVVDQNTVRALTPHTISDAQQYNEWLGSAPGQRDSLRGEWDLEALPGENAVYVSFESAMFEYPVAYNKSKSVYYSGIYAFDKNGSLLWSKPTDSFASSMEADNGTIYYATRGGQLSMAQFGLTGIAALAVAYLFIRFFLLGSVARARSRLDKNDNRNKVLDFIVQHPGLTMSELSRDMGMNLGTVRYHLFILGLNHRIVENKADGKSIRYFTNSGSYSKDEQFIVSLVRREPVRKMIGLLLEKPGLSNGELAKELSMGESAVCRYTKELLNKGVIVRGADGFSVADAFKERVASALVRIGSL